MLENAHISTLISRSDSATSSPETDPWMSDPWMSIRQIAKYTGFCERKIYNDMRAKRIEAVQVGTQWRARHSRVDRYMQAGSR